MLRNRLYVSSPALQSCSKSSIKTLGQQQIVRSTAGHTIRLASSTSTSTSNQRPASQTTRRQASTLPFVHSPSEPPPPPLAPQIDVLNHQSIPDLEVKLLPTSISIVCPSHGIDQPFEIDHTWLRDTCQEVGSSVQAGTGQKLTGTSDVPIARNGQGLLDS